MAEDQGYSFVIPCYRESPEVVSRTVEALTRSLGDSVSYEVIIVNDGGDKDAVPEFPDERVTVLVHETNQGYGASLMSGILRARHEWIGIVDADGTYPIDHFRRLLDFTHDNDMVVGKRSASGTPRLRRLPKFLLMRLASFLVNQEIPDLNSGMRLFRKSIVLGYRKLFPRRFSFTTTLTMVCLTNFYKVRFVDIPYYAREGKSAIQPLRDTVRFFSLVFRLALYFRPLRFFIPLSGIVFLLAVARAVRDVLVVNQFGGLTLVLSFMAFQIFFFGLIAEVVSKK